MNNAAWRSATQVRSGWLRGFLHRKTAPKGSAAFVADALARGDHALRRAFERNHPLAHDLLGVEPAQTGWGTRPHNLSRAVEQASEARAQMIALAVALAACEDAADVGSWRPNDPGTRRYLAFLHAHGYPLSEVEARTLAADKGNTGAERDDDEHAAEEDEDADRTCDNDAPHGGDDPAA